MFLGRAAPYRRRMQHDVDHCSAGNPEQSHPSVSHLLTTETTGRRPPMRTSSFRLLASTLAVLPLAASCSLRTSAPPTAAEVGKRLDHLAVPFVENAGQSDPRVAYYSPTFSGTVFVTREGEVVYAVPAPGHRAPAAGLEEPANGWTLTETFVDGHPAPAGAHAAATHLSGFTGNDPARRPAGVARCKGASLGAVWPRISVPPAAHGHQRGKGVTGAR